jgi:hypothetical protein
MAVKQSVSIYFTDERLSWLDEETKRTGRSRSEIVGVAIDQLRGHASTEEEWIRNIVREEIVVHREGVLKLVEDLLAEHGKADHGIIDHALLARRGQILITISALELIIKDLEEGNEPTPKEIGNKLGVAAQSVGMYLGRSGIYTDRIDNRNVYKKEMIERIKSELKKLREQEPEKPSSSILSL